MTPQETLRFAAEQMRRLNPPGRSGREFWHALADWLDESTEQEPPEALRVARAYLGEPE